MSIHDNTKILKQPIFDDNGDFQGWDEFSPKVSAQAVLMPKNNVTVNDAINGLAGEIGNSGDYSWQESSGGSTSKKFPCVYLGAGDAITALSVAADHSVTMRNTAEIDFLILSLPKDVTPRYSLRLLTVEASFDTAANTFTQQLVTASRYSVTLQRTGAGAIARVTAAGSGVDRTLLDADTGLTQRQVVGAILDAYIDV